MARRVPSPQNCGVGVLSVIGFDPRPDAAAPAVTFNAGLQNGRFGNKLGAFFTALGLANLGGFGTANSSFQYGRRAPPIFMGK